ncbi:MAG: nucleotidyltransferase domain-containing protein [Saprospiraceae bacterium]|nr:nucleotidyltransferase domain-containing protein [Saprospiraceae bacterium]MCF8248765.1 nucleotidyltransferase domain-containing protein [Saprospiraceae bacterium]MCF8278745.1 nucleotidyltransferase domain-containing protein [Bacteroidales bacterium]MCF8310545.1 nucleotidyltransferase domain-containing protein [Saprospiraceae bacterium]MCF8439104.1 nucleotidyltransferase domain-containing protein [Saprospiraceae bacterium]
MSNKDTIKSILEDNKELLSKEFGIRRLGIFGSVATGNSNEDSDIDLFYELREGSFLDLRQLEAFEEKVKKILQHKKIDLVNLSFMNPIVRYRAEKSFIYV